MSLLKKLFIKKVYWALTLNKKYVKKKEDIIEEKSEFLFKIFVIKMVYWALTLNKKYVKKEEDIIEEKSEFFF